MPLALLAALGTARAHQIWIEQPGADAPTAPTAVVRFGEFGDNLREASPGLLDKLGPVRGALLGRPGGPAVSAAAVKGGDGYALPFGAAAGESIIAEAAHYPLYTNQQGPQPQVHWYRPAARLVTGPAALPPELDLDLVPTGEPGHFRVYFRGQPLAKAKVGLATPSGWGREAHSDADGRVRFELPWRGQYVAEVAHTHREPGERRGLQGTETYDVVNYVTSLTLQQAKGLAPLPAGPAAQPHPTPKP